MTDEDLMRRAIALAATHVGLTGDNPSVGCVIARDGVVLGEGVTGEGGRPHAEEQALEQAGEAARGATAFVTLEPCAQRSAGGVSCSARLIAGGVARVAVACGDPSVFADGAGTLWLRSAGVSVDLGLLRSEADRLYAAYSPAKPSDSSR